MTQVSVNEEKETGEEDEQMVSLTIVQREIEAQNVKKTLFTYRKAQYDMLKDKAWEDFNLKMNLLRKQEQDAVKALKEELKALDKCIADLL